MKNMNFSKNEIDALLRMAGQKIGKDPENLRHQMESGDINAVLEALTPGQRSQITNFMNNPQAVEQFISNPRIQEILKGLIQK